MGKTIEFLQKCYNTKILEENYTWKDLYGKGILLIGVYMVVMPLYIPLFYYGYILIQGIVWSFFSGNPLIENNWLSVGYGLLFGMISASILLSIPKQDKTPHQILFSLLHNLVYIMAIFIVITIYSAVITGILSVFRLI